MSRLAAIVMGASLAVGALGIASAQTYKTENKTQDENGKQTTKSKTKVKHHGKEVKTTTKTKNTSH